MSPIGKSTETESIFVEQGVTANGFLFGGNDKILKLDSGDGCTTLNLLKHIYSI